LKLIYGQDARVAEWVRSRAPHAENGFEKYVAIGIESEGDLIAGCVYNDFRGHAMHVSIASSSPRWATKRTLQALFDYPFRQLHVERLTAYTGKSMASVRTFLVRLGFVEEGVIRKGFADDDAVIYGMLRKECRWIQGQCHEILAVSTSRA
jgi:RimJ/RimL family protein N-acetyltransferase